MEIPFSHLRTDQQIVGGLQEFLQSPLIGIDTETTGLDPRGTSRVLLVQLSNGTKNIVIDLTKDNSLARRDIHSGPFRMLQDILQGPATKIAHNMIFDFNMIRSHFGFEMQKVYCTMLAERILTSGKTAKSRMVSLKSIVPKYTDLTELDMNKAIRSDFYSGYILDDFTEDHLLYAARDSAVLLPIYWQQVYELQRENMVPVAELEFQVIPVTASMEWEGVNLDREKWGHAITSLERDRLYLRRKIESYLKPLVKQKGIFDDFCPISLDSNKQMQGALRRLGLPIEDSVDKHTLDKLYGKHPIIEPLLEYRSLQKLITGYGDGLIARIHPLTGRIHAHFMQLGTDTGRFSSNSCNLQNIPSGDDSVLRECFVAPEGYVALGADYSQQELRVLAAIANETNMLEAYWNNEDVHTQTTSKIFKISMGQLKALLESRDAKIEQHLEDMITEEEKDASRKRKIAKSGNFLISYGGGYTRLAAAAKIDESLAKQVMADHARAFPALNKFIESEGSRTLQRMYSETLLGRKRFYTLPAVDDPMYHIIEGAIRRQGVNHVIQGTSSDIMKSALVLIHNRFTKKFGRANAYLWATVHDEGQAMVREDLVGEAKIIMEQSMKEAFERFISPEICPIKIECKFGKSWTH